MANIVGNNPPVLNDVSYVDKIKNSLDAIDDHDHSSGKGLPVAAGGFAAGSIDNDDINAAAAIARTKIANGTADHVVINNGSGTLSSEATLAKSRGGTGADNSSVTFPASGTIVTEAGSQALTNKTINGSSNTITNVSLATGVTGTLPIANGGTGQTAATAAFDALAPTTTAGDVIVHNGTDNVRQAIGSDGQVLVVDTAQTNKLKWTTLQQGAKNYVTYNNFENNAITGWNEISATYSSNTPSGTPTISASAAANLTIAATSTTPLAGTYSMLATLTAPSAGVGFCTDALTIDREDRAKVLQWSFYYEVKSGSGDFSGTSANTFSVWIYQDNGSTQTWTQPAGVYNMTQSSGQGFATGTFQTNSDTTTVRLVVFVNTSATISVNFDDFYLGPQKVVYGAPVGDWQSYVPTITATSVNPSKGTTSTDIAYYRRVGDSLEIQYTYIQTVAGTSGTGTYRFSIPTGLTIDTTKLSVTSSSTLGHAYGYDGTNEYTGYVRESNTTTLQMALFTSISAGGNVGSTLVPLGNTTARFAFTCTLPISGWSSNTVMSSDTDTRVVAARYYRSTAQAITSGGSDQIMDYATKDFDTHNAVTTGASWKFTAPVSGTYKVSASAYLASTAGWELNEEAEISLYKNGSRSCYLDVKYIQVAGPITAAIMVGGSTSITLSAGDYIDFRLFQTNDSSVNTEANATLNYCSIERISGPATIAASEFVGVRASASTTTSTTGAGNAVVMPTKEFDTHGAYNTSTGVFTCPVSGKYEVGFTGVATAIATGGVDRVSRINVVRTGSDTGTYRIANWGSQASATVTPYFSGNDVFNCIAGDTLTIYYTHGSSGLPASALDGTSNTHCYFKKVG